MKKQRITFTLLFLLIMIPVLGQKDWAKFHKYENQNKQIKAPIEAVFMGNSITEFWVKKDAAFFEKYHFIGRGISGQTSSEMLVRFQSDVIQLHPKKVIILAGTNDIAENNGIISLQHIFENIVSMTELARYHKIEPIICSVLPADQFSWRPSLEPASVILQLNRQLKAYAQRQHLVFVDYHTAMKDQKNGLPLKYSKDGVHPNIEGYKVMEKVLMNHLNKK
jgi:lysophospholipase L1-like esterase